MVSVRPLAAAAEAVSGTAVRTGKSIGFVIAVGIAPPGVLGTADNVLGLVVAVGGVTNGAVVAVADVGILVGTKTVSSA